MFFTVHARIKMYVCISLWFINWSLWIVVYMFSVDSMFQSTNSLHYRTSLIPNNYIIQHWIVSNLNLEWSVLPVFFAVLLLLRGRVQRGQTVLLVGLSDSGKTLLFSRVSTCTVLTNNTIMYLFFYMVLISPQTILHL